MDYSRGAEWRRWDLHIHTPFSVLNNGFGDDFAAYAKEVLRRALDLKIAAIGLTDYFSIDGYRAFRDYLNNSARLEADFGTEDARRAASLLVIPNIELRASLIVNNSRVNFHVLFSDAVAPDDIEEHFLRELKFSAEASPDHPDERWAVSRKNLEDLGKRLKQEHAKFRKDSDLFVGMMNAVVDHHAVSKAIEDKRSKFSGKVVLCTPVDEDLSKCSWDGQAHLSRKLLIQKSHFFFSSNQKTREFGLGSFHPGRNEFLSEFKSLKPCIHGSDAHDFNTLFRPADGRYTWIKADPTFEGLRQVLNEPEERVRIGSEPRVFERIRSHPTKLITSVTINKLEDATLSETWFDCDIPLNPELVAIIGNKGSGKSALSDIIGLLGNTSRHDKFSFLNAEKFRNERNNKARSFKASLRWSDGQMESVATLADNPPASAVEKVKYIPQSYLETICNDVKLGKESPFYSELEEVIFSHVPEAEQAGFATLAELLAHLSEETNNAIRGRIQELDGVIEQVIALEEKLSPRQRASLNAQLDERRRELVALKEPVPVTKPEADPSAQAEAKAVSDALDTARTAVRDLSEMIATSRGRDAILAKQQIVCNKLQSRLRQLKVAVDSAVAEVKLDAAELNLDAEKLINFNIDSSAVDQLAQAIMAERTTIAGTLNPDRDGSLARALVTKQSEIEQLQLRLGAADREYQAYVQAKTNWEADRAKLKGSPEAVGSISYLETQIKQLEEEVPSRLKALERERDRKLLEIFREKVAIRDSYRKYYGAVQDTLAKHPLSESASFKLSFSVTNREIGFAGKFLPMIHRGRMGPFMGEDEGGAEIRQRLAAANFDSPRSTLRFARSIVRSMKWHNGRELEVSDQLRHKQGADVAQLYRYIFSLEYLTPIYNLLWDGKGLEQLSPGERGNLLLIFYLLIDKSNTPLVIDQPEENLDNQTVFRVLVPCIKDAKQRRQMVIVTHNPNLAVVCDAEQVICASIDKAGDQRVDYLSGSIENPKVNQKLVDILEGTRPAFDKRDDKYLVG